MFRNRNYKKVLMASAATACLVMGVTAVSTVSVATAGTFPGCTSAQLKVKVSQSYAGMSHQGIDVDLTNVSRQVCIVSGGPRAVMRSDGGPAQLEIGSTPFSKPQPAAYNLLQPGTSVRTNLAWDEMAGRTSPHGLALSINDGSAAVTIPHVESRNVSSYDATNFRKLTEDRRN